MLTGLCSDCGEVILKISDDETETNESHYGERYHQRLDTKEKDGVDEVDTQEEEPVLIVWVVCNNCKTDNEFEFEIN